MDKLALLSLLYLHLQRDTPPEIEHVSFDNDHDSGEIIIDTVDEDGNEVSYAISTEAIRDIEPA